MSTPVALVISRPELTDELVRELAQGIGTQARIETAGTITEAVSADHRDVALVLIDCRDSRVDELIVPLKERPAYANSRVLAVVGDHVRDAAVALDRGWVAAFVGLPMTPGMLAEHSARQLARWLARHGPDADPAAPVDVVAPDSDLLRDFEASEDARTQELITAIERALGPRPRIRLPAGIRLTRQGRPIDGVYVVLEGQVALTRKVGDETMLFHQATTGRVVGILALSTQAKSRFTSTTTTPAVVVHLSTDQLDQALQLEPQVSAILASSAVSQLSTRLAHSEHLQAERRVLYRRLQQERAELAEALDQLRTARMELIAQARFATLGELSAGVAHELNNPVAALVRSSEHLLDDVQELLATNPQGRLIAQTMDASAKRGATSTREERQARREMARKIGDDELARRLFTAGVRDLDVARAATKDAELAATIELSAKLGTALRAIGLAANHITRLVASLRSYARPDADLMDGVSVNDSLEDTITLVSHRLDGVQLLRDYGDLPGIKARSAQLGQVWTNILVNSADALQGSGSIAIRTRRAGNQVVITITDDGPGIPDEILERVFEPHFTTKHGQVRFGMGMGLGIAAHFVHDHGGTVDIESRPGRTSVSVRLPVTGPTDESTPPTQEST